MCYEYFSLSLSILRASFTIVLPYLWKKCKRFWIGASSQDWKTNVMSEPHSALLLPLSCGLEHCCLRLFNCLSSGAHAHFLERSYISPSPLSCRRYIVSVVKNGDRKGGAFTRIQIDPFLRGTYGRVSLATAEKPARTVYKGVVAFCGNNQQVVAKQGYECISSAVNTVARRVRRHSFSFGPSLKGRRFCAPSPTMWEEREYGGRKDEGRRTRVLATIYTIDVVAWRSLLFLLSLGVLAIHDAPHPFHLGRILSLREDIPDFLLTDRLPSSVVNFLQQYLFAFTRWQYRASAASILYI